MSTLHTRNGRVARFMLPQRFWTWLVRGAKERRLRARRRWLRHTTELEFSRLPPEIRKDVGWPTRQDD